MTAKFTNLKDQTAILGPLNNCTDGEDHGYSLPRNHYIRMTGTLDLGIDLELSIMGWKKGLAGEYNPGIVYELEVDYESYALAGFNPTAFLVVEGEWSIQVRTTYPGGWTAALSTSATEIIAPSNFLYDWITMTKSSGNVGTEEILLSIVYQNSRSECYIHITAGNMTAVVTVRYFAMAV
ncbi:MAG: hypothetical protein LIP08_03430 [Bacteroides sp.]|nr:hypothetical protein [Bacteroides sp.]